MRTYYRLYRKFNSFFLRKPPIMAVRTSVDHYVILRLELSVKKIGWLIIANVYKSVRSIFDQFPPSIPNDISPFFLTIPSRITLLSFISFLNPRPSVYFYDESTKIRVLTMDCIYKAGEFFWNLQICIYMPINNEWLLN